MSLTLSPHIQKMYDQAKAARSNRPKVGAPKRPSSSRRASRCTMLHQGERITFNLSKASTCPPGFMSIAKGVHVQPTGKPERAPKAKKTRAKKAAAPKAPKAPKARKKRAKKAAAPKKSNGKKKRSPAQIAATKRMLAARKASMKKKR